MPSDAVVTRIYSWATSQRNLTIFVSIFLAVPVAYIFQSYVAGGEQAASFLLLLTIAVGIPTAYDEYWPHYDQAWLAVSWVMLAAAIVTAEFSAFYLLGRQVLEFSPFLASVGAFLLTDIGNLVWLVHRQRSRD